MANKSAAAQITLRLMRLLTDLSFTENVRIKTTIEAMRVKSRPPMKSRYNAAGAEVRKRSTVRRVARESVPTDEIRQTLAQVSKR